MFDLLDVVLSAALLAIVIVIRVAYPAHGPHAPVGWFRRLTTRAKSGLFGHTLVDATYWAIGPIAKRLVADRVSANAVTFASLAFGGAAGIALSAGHFGIGAWLAASSALCDALDGLVARASGTASPAGDALDASVDRYSEFFFLTGLALHFRSSPWILAVVLLALHGAFMMSFADLKAQGLRDVVPPGWMRRPDRAILLIAGAALSGLGVGAGAPRLLALAPLIAALVVDSVGANAAAARRLLRVVAQLDRSVTASSVTASSVGTTTTRTPDSWRAVPVHVSHTRAVG